MEPQYYRTFIGIPVTVGSEIYTLRRQLMEALSEERISWVNTLNYHVTLRFLGDTDVALIPQIKEELQKMIKLPLKSNLQLKGPGSFGPRKKPRVIWLGFDQDEPFHSLRSGTDRALEKCGWHLSDKPFRAHLTLGRIRSLKDPARYYEIIEQMKGTFTGRAELDRMVFYRSELGESGPTYTALKQMKFLS
jgi:2'-5' RNA ligase